MKCSVCSNKINENYCSNCGQYFKNERISTKSVFEDLFGNIFSLDKSFFNNIKTGLINPKIIILNYWNGFRRYYFSPSKFLVIASLLFVIQIAFFNNFFGIIVNSKVAPQFSLLFVIILVLSLFSFITYLKYKKTFYEHLILNIYNTSLWSIIFVPISMILSVLNTDKTIKTVFLLFYLLLIIVWNSKVFEMKKYKRFRYVTLNIILIVIIPLVVELFRKFTS
jgi:hypothetical protein